MERKAERENILRGNKGTGGQTSIILETQRKRENKRQNQEVNWQRRKRRERRGGKKRGVREEEERGGIGENKDLEKLRRKTINKKTNRKREKRGKL